MPDPSKKVWISGYLIFYDHKIAQNDLSYHVVFTCCHTGSKCPAKSVDEGKDFDPDAGDFKEEIIYEKTVNGIYEKHAYISACQ